MFTCEPHTDATAGVAVSKYRRYDNAVEDMLKRFSVQSYRPGHRINLDEISYQVPY